MFQSGGLLRGLSVVTAIQPSLYMVPLKWYREMKGKFAGEAQGYIERLLTDRLSFETVEVVKSEAAATEDLVREVAGFAKKQGFGLLAVASAQKKGMPYWLLGSFSETAALTASIPVLVVKPALKREEFAREPRLIVTVDVLTPPAVAAIKWIKDFVAGTKTKVELVYAQGGVLSPVEDREGMERSALQDIASRFSEVGLPVEVKMLTVEKSAAQTLVEYADERKAWAIVTVATQKMSARRLVLGSVSRQILQATKRPFLSVR
jgi:nucleotide-binding universal stress UspA family protein